MNPIFLQNYINYQSLLVRNALLQQQLVAQHQLNGLNSIVSLPSLPIVTPKESPTYIEDANDHNESAYYSEASSDTHSLNGSGPAYHSDRQNCRATPTASVTNTIDTLSNESCAGKSKKCQFCPAIFKSNTDVKRHERIHTGEKPFECTICKKQFNRKGNMEKHLTTHYKGAGRIELLKAAHAAKKPFVCECGKAFKSRGFYLRHRRQHDIESTRLEKATDSLSGTKTSTDDDENEEIDVEF